MRVAVVGGGAAGLYFALLAKKAWPGWEIEVFERNRSDDSFGFGVVFSDETLDNFREYDRESYEAIREVFVYWDEIDFVFHGETVRSAGHGFCGCARRDLLSVLHRRCAGLGVALSFESEIGDPAALQGFDLVIGADGVNSTVRERYSAAFRPRIEHRRNRFLWLGTTRPHEAFTFDFTENEHGIWVLGAYSHAAGESTWIVEAPEPTWERAKGEVAGLPEPELLAWMEALWADRLDGHPLIANRSIWRTFPMVRNERWWHGNAVLLGDALHTAHYSIGSGTKLAMEDAIALYEAFRGGGELSEVLARFEADRRPEVERTQHASDTSVIWTENPGRYWGMAPVQAAFSMLSRSKQVTYDNLRLRDSGFVDRVDRWFREDVRRAGLAVGTGLPPMFTPFRLRGMTLANRVVVSPMDMYSAEDGEIGDFHFVHLGGLALGGAGLVFSEMLCVSAEGRITPGCAGLYTDTQTAAWRRIVDFVHAESDARVAIQLGHSGAQGLDPDRLGGDGHAAVRRQLAADRAVGDPLPRVQPGAARDDPGRHGPGDGRVRERRGSGARDRRRHARAPHGAWLPAVELHHAGQQPAHRRIRRSAGEPDALSAAGVRRGARRVAGRQADLGAHLGDRLGRRGRGSRAPTRSVSLPC